MPNLTAATQDEGLEIPSLTKFYGCYTYREECCVILAFADEGSLEDYMKTKPRPERTGDIIALRGQLFELAQVLHRVHWVRMLHCVQFLSAG